MPEWAPTFYGMSDRLQNICYYNNNEYQFSKPYSEKTAEIIDEEVRALIGSQYERAKKVLLENKEGHAKLAQILFDREVIFAEDLENIFGKRQWTSRTDEILAENENDTETTEEGGAATSHKKENEEIIRQKIVQAVLEKAEKQGKKAEDDKTEEKK